MCEMRAFGRQDGLLHVYGLRECRHWDQSRVGFVFADKSERRKLRGSKFILGGGGNESTRNTEHGTLYRPRHRVGLASRRGRFGILTRIFIARLKRLPVTGTEDKRTYDTMK